MFVGDVIRKQLVCRVSLGYPSMSYFRVFGYPNETRHLHPERTIRLASTYINSYIIQYQQYSQSLSYDWSKHKQHISQHKKTVTDISSQNTLWLN